MDSSTRITPKNTREETAGEGKKKEELFVNHSQTEAESQSRKKKHLAPLVKARHLRALLTALNHWILKV